MKRKERQCPGTPKAATPPAVGTIPLRSEAGEGRRSGHVNGWPVIAAGLKAQGLRQIDLAARLAVSPSAVSQMKTGRVRLNAGQLNVICSFLRLDDAMIRALYGEIVEARLGWGEAVAGPEDAGRRLSGSGCRTLCPERRKS